MCKHSWEQGPVGGVLEKVDCGKTSNTYNLFEKNKPLKEEL